MSRLRLLDISGIFFPVWRKKEAMGRPIGEAAAETVQALRERAAGGAADHVVACCDAANNFRTKIAEEYRAIVPAYLGYKSHRPKKDPAMMAALNRAVSEIEADGVPVFRVDGFEADDVIATLTFWAVEQGHDVEIVSGDKDLRQLVCDPRPDEEHCPSVCVVERDGTVHNEAAVLRDFGVPPSRLAALLALAGDASDGVLGIPNVGKARAAALLWGETDEADQWRPTPYRSFNEVVSAAVEEQATVERVEHEKVRRRVVDGTKKGAKDEIIATKLKIALEDVERYRVMPPFDFPADYKPTFHENVRKSLITNAGLFEISFRLTQLRRDVPLDFAAVTAPRVPKPNPMSDEWQAQRERAANINATIEQEETETMQEPTNPALVIEPSAPAQKPAPPVIVEHPQSSAAPAVAAQSAALALSKPAATRVPRTYEMELEPRSYDEAMLVAEHAAESRLFKDIATPAAAIMLISLGRKFGLSAVDSLRMIHMIEGRPSMSAQLIVGIVQKSGMAEFFEIESMDEKQATWVTKRKGARRETRWSFSVEDAKTAKLGGIHKPENRGSFDPNSNWAKHPKVMCMWRAAVFLARAVYTDLVGGLYMPDELGGVEPMEIDGNPPLFGAMEQAA